MTDPKTGGENKTMERTKSYNSASLAPTGYPLSPGERHNDVIRLATWTVKSASFFHRRSSNVMFNRSTLSQPLFSRSCCSTSATRRRASITDWILRLVCSSCVVVDASSAAFAPQKRCTQTSRFEMWWTIIVTNTTSHGDVIAKLRATCLQLI